MRLLCCSLVCFAMISQVGFCQDSDPSTVLENPAIAINESTTPETSEGYFEYLDNSGPIEMHAAGSSCHCQHCSQPANRNRLRSRRPIRKCRHANCGCKSKPALGFAVEEVQYGANAGLPSFGYISHGPWTTLEKRELLRRRYLLARLKSKCVSKRGQKKSCGRNGCTDCHYSAENSEPGYYSEPGYASASHLPSSNEIHFDQGDAIDSYPLDSNPAEFEIFDADPIIHQ